MDIAKFIDHTFLKPAGGEDAVRKLCREAKKAGIDFVKTSTGFAADGATRLGTSAELKLPGTAIYCCYHGLPLITAMGCGKIQLCRLIRIVSGWWSQRMFFGLLAG